MSTDKAKTADVPEHACGSTGFGLGLDDVCEACQWWRRKWDMEHKTMPYAEHLAAMEALRAEVAARDARIADLTTRMDRARNILTNGNPRPECNWHD